jgi:hypothetical protein
MTITPNTSLEPTPVTLGSFVAAILSLSKSIVSVPIRGEFNKTLD